MAEEVYRSEKKIEKGDKINLTVYINVIKEESVSPQQKEAIRKVRKIYADWMDEGNDQ